MGITMGNGTETGRRQNEMRQNTRTNFTAQNWAESN